MPIVLFLVRKMRGIVLGIAMFMFLVIIHELGHFLAAKKVGVQVLEFGIGIPPKILRRRKDKKGTAYTINWIPLGGFVRLKGEDPRDPETFHASDSFITVGFRKKMLVLFAGVIVNTLTAWLFFSIVFMKGLTPINVIPDNALVGGSESYLMPTYSFLKQEGLLLQDGEPAPAQIVGVAKGSLADEAGLLSGDVILSVNDAPVTNETLSTELLAQRNTTFPLVVERADETITKQISCPEDACVLGVAVGLEGEQILLPKQVTGLAAFGAGWHELIAQTKLTFRMLGTLGKNLFSLDREKMSASVQKLSGPVGIIKVGESIYKQSGAWMYLAFAGMISLALAIFNVLPIPALDGGRALGVIIQSLGKLKPEKYFVIENYFNMFFFVLLMGLGIYIILLDLSRFRGVQILGV